MKATLSDTTGSIPLDVFEEHIPNIKQGQSYTLTNIQLKIWSGRKKVSTTRRTTITESNHEKLTAITVQENEEEDPPTYTAVIKEVTNVPHFEKFFKCYNCFKKVSQSGTSKVSRCAKYGMIKADKCTNGLSVTIEVIDDKGKSLALKVTSEILKKLIQEEELSLEENTVGEKLLFMENFQVTYDAKFVILSINLLKGN